MQHEIEEQKRRELDLKRDGRVQSISEERADIDSAFDDQESIVTQLSSSSSSTLDPALQKATIKVQRAFFENASTANSETITIPTTERMNGKFLVKPIFFKNSTICFYYSC